MTTGFLVRTATAEEAITVFKHLSDVEQWNPGNKDAEYFQRTYPDHFFVGELDGEVVSCVTAVPYGDCAFMGMYIVKPEHRKKGYGFKTFQTALDSVKDKNVSLDAVLQEIKTYEKSGFVVHSFLQMRHHGKFDVTNLYKPNKNIVPLNTFTNEQIAKYEESIIGFYRPEIWELYKNYEGGYSVAYAEDSKLEGLGVIRPGSNAYKIGPLFAKDTETAKQIFIELVNSIPKDSYIQMDVPSANAEAVKFAEGFLGFKNVFECKKMWTREPPKHIFNQIYGSFALEYG
ncbi:hypothetical protein CONCODRAFT_8439 [Conidiobolus coronatus NRRL 28638]|uniref:N-acetyltransferase domain-containing protein n=1 Tax=Conidiobolus coronatus (strain ATCC 28846 / CBS 209.66 / NRRL 28638) TaxID=796925 RepID=A0A137P2H9_CONC2|nr:hypothetical protein CONCODRAFT_8439 [Conidiobolus coronatus NRRL 28638]|eukprot:KXN69212.1 hypothetical protein CONCODRAFT_8439 [Conidiobolus coronatus NRRL 28638]